jgi:hypothetical protein
MYIRFIIAPNLFGFADHVHAAHEAKTFDFQNVYLILQQSISQTDHAYFP